MMTGTMDADITIWIWECCDEKDVRYEQPPSGKYCDRCGQWSAYVKINNGENNNTDNQTITDHASFDSLRKLFIYLS